VRGDDLISLTREDETWYYLYDGHGSVRQLADEDGAVTDTYTYDAFGNLTNRTGTTENSYLYAGEQFDGTTGLYYLRARYMNPATGTFLSMDSYPGSIFDPVSLHKYLYANANPIMYTDPTGYFSLGEIGSAMAISRILDGMMYGWLFGGLFGGTINMALAATRGASPAEMWEAFFYGFANGSYYGSMLGGLGSLAQFSIIARLLMAGTQAWFAGNLYAAALEDFLNGNNADGAIELILSIFGAGSAVFTGWGGMAGYQPKQNEIIKVIGRLEDTSVAKDWTGHEVLNDPNWTLAKNDAWILSGISNKQSFYIASPITPQNLVSSNPLYPGETVFARELRMLTEAGYTRVGDYMVAPN
jgi:RHS repeat-associated protein